MRFRFTSAEELLESLDRSGLSLPEFMVEREAASSGASGLEIRDELERRIMLTRGSLERGLNSLERSYSGLSGGMAAKYASFSSPIVGDPLFNRCVAYALAVNEVNACGGKIVAFPTAGSCGIVPGAIWAWRDTKEASLTARDSRLQDAFLVASAIGALIAARATLSGAAGGCQAECGAAGAMAAAALSFFVKGNPRSCLNAAALALKNSLGLACDPVAGLVEIPCVKRNAFLAVNALTAASLDAAGIESAIPFDDVLSAMKSIGDAMPASCRETAEGGLAATPTGAAIRDRLAAAAP
jgi:L-serine dehydratase